MEGRTCVCCRKEIDENNDAMFIRRMLSDEEYKRYEPHKKDICVECKQELLYANIIEVC